jgi:hypothetical protein
MAWALCNNAAMNKTRRFCLMWATAVGVAAALATLTACGSFGVPNKVTLSAAQLQSMLERSFPVERQLLDLLEVRATSPSLRLLPQTNRLAATVELNLREKVLATRMRGRLDFDAGLRWEPIDHTVRLHQVRVQELTLDAAPGAAAHSAAGAAKTVAAALTERALENLVLYRVAADKLAEMDRFGVRPTTLNITNNGLEITLEPKAK